MSHSQPPVRWWIAPSSSTYQPAFLTFRTKKPACCFTRTTWNWLLSLSWLYPIPDCMPYAWRLINTVQIETWSWLVLRGYHVCFYWSYVHWCLTHCIYIHRTGESVTHCWSMRHLSLDRLHRGQTSFGLTILVLKSKSPEISSNSANADKVWGVGWIY